MIEIKIEDEGTQINVSLNIRVSDKKMLAYQMVVLQAKLREAGKEIVPEDELEPWVAMLSTAMRDGVPLEEVKE